MRWSRTSRHWSKNTISQLRVAVIAIVLSLVCLVPLPGSQSLPVFAHANLVEASPAPNSTLDVAPSQVVIWFTEPIEPRLSEIQVLNARGGRADDDDLQFDPNDPTVMSVGMELVPDGTYTVAWKNVSTVDGHRVRGSYLFSVGVPISGEALEEPEGPLLQSPAEPILRWVLLLGALAMVGGLVLELFVTLPALEPRRGGAAVRELLIRLAIRSIKLTWASVAVFSVASVAQVLLQASLIYEVSVTRAIGPPAWATLSETGWGELWLWRMGLAGLFVLPAFGLTALVVRQSGERAPSGVGMVRAALGVRVVALIAGCGVLWTLSLTSHAAATIDIRNLAVIADFVHLLAAAVWVGGLFHLCVGIPLFLRILSARQRRECLARFVPRFSVVAGLSVAVLVVTGFFSGWAQVTVPEALSVLYGRVLTVKVALVAALLIIGAVNLVWVRPGLARRDGRARWLRRTVTAEVVLAVLVLGTVGLLTSLEPARQVASRMGIGAPEAPSFQDTDEGTTMTLRVDPGRVGANDLTIRLEDRLGRPITNATDVRARVKYVDSDLGEDTSSSTPVGDGSYVLEGVPLSIAGAWQVELLVNRTDAFDSRTAFRFEVAPGGGSWAIAPSPERAGLLFGGGLVLLGVVFMAMAIPLGGWFTRAGAGVMVPGIVGLAIGVVFLVNTPIGQTSPELVNPFPPTPDSLETGEAVYLKTCQTCHGDGGRGDGPTAPGLNPPPADLVVHVPLHPEGDLFGYIHDGIPGTAMVPLGGVLAEDEIWHVVNYVRTFEE